MRVLSGLLIGLVLAATPADSTDAAPADTTTTPDLSCVFDHFHWGTDLSSCVSYQEQEPEPEVPAEPEVPEVEEPEVEEPEVEEPEVEEPEVEEPAEPTAPTDNADALAQLQAELDALRGENDALRGDLSAARDSLASRTAIGGGRQVVRDTVIVSHTDTLLFCPPTDQERRDLFDLFTGANDDTTEAEGPAGKTASVQLESWGAIKSLIQE